MVVYLVNFAANSTLKTTHNPPGLREKHRPQFLLRSEWTYFFRQMTILLFQLVWQEPNIPRVGTTSGENGEVKFLHQQHSGHPGLAKSRQPMADNNTILGHARDLSRHFDGGDFSVTTPIHHNIGLHAGSALLSESSMPGTSCPGHTPLPFMQGQTGDWQ